MDKTKFDIWGIFGKIGAVLGTIWVIIQLSNYFFKINDYEAEAKGSHSFYEVSPKYRESYQKAKDYKAIVKSIIKNEGVLKNYELDTLLFKIKKQNESYIKTDFDFYSEYDNTEDLFYKDSEIWRFSIKNSGLKPLEELVLELPFEGSYKIIFSDNTEKIGKFDNKIEIGELRSTYEIKIICWVKSLNSDILWVARNNEEKSRFTHKYGWFPIKYPLEVDGLSAFNEKNDWMPFWVFTMVIIVLSMVVGIHLYKKGEKERNRDKSSNENS